MIWRILLQGFSIEQLFREFGNNLQRVQKEAEIETSECSDFYDGNYASGSLFENAKSTRIMEQNS